MDENVRSVFVLLADVRPSNLGNSTYCNLMLVSRECLHIFIKCVIQAHVKLRKCSKSVAKMRGLTCLPKLLSLAAWIEDDVPLNVFSWMTRLEDLKVRITTPCTSRRVLSVAALKDLRSFDFSMHTLDTAFVVHFCSLDFRCLSELVKLTELSMRSVIADDFGAQLATMSSLSNLKKLRLHRCMVNLTDLSGLHSGIEDIDVQEAFGGDLAFAASYSGLKNLVADRAHIVSIEALRDATQLEHLSIAGNYPFSDISPVSALRNLATLNIAYNATDTVEVLSACSKLVRLDISGCRVQNLSPLARCPMLTNLKCDMMSVFDISALRGATKLMHLTFSGCVQLDDISPLASLPGLQFLDVTGTAVSGERTREFASLRERAGLRVVHIYADEVYEEEADPGEEISSDISSDDDDDNVV
jgi:hypothetical protein